MNQNKITMLNSMADTDFIKSLDKQSKWGIKILDLKDHIYGKALIDLSDKEAVNAYENIKKREMSVYCLSTTLFFEDIELGENNFRSKYNNQLERILELAKIFRPKLIRLLAAKSSKKNEFLNIIPYIKKNHTWLFNIYNEAIEKISVAGFKATIENEANNCILSNPEEVLGFFKELNKEKVSLTLDIQNLWQMGTYPSIEVCEILSGITEYFHLKGSRSLEVGGHTYYGVSLEDSSWPVIEVTQNLLNLNKELTICLNPVKGEKLKDYNYSNITRRDLDYLLQNIKGE